MTTNKRTYMVQYHQGDWGGHLELILCHSRHVLTITSIVS